MLAIRIPFFTVQAEDDPVSPPFNSKVNVELITL